MTHSILLFWWLILGAVLQYICLVAVRNIQGTSEAGDQTTNLKLAPL